MTHQRIAGLDGLRGVAVLLVVVYHFAPGRLPGGFLGVDVFFVLSGYLISSLIIREVEQDANLSLRGFWNRRFRRLMPAALLAVTTVVLLSRWYLTEYSRSSLRAHALSTLGYAANWWEIASSNTYEQEFGVPSPLQHFWSLAIEEQFYLVFPLVCLLIVAWSKRSTSRRQSARPESMFTTRLLIVSSVGLVCSSLTMILMQQHGFGTSRMYFGTETRVQAILVGVVVACVGARHHTETPQPPRESRRGNLPIARMISPWILLILIVAAATQLRFESRLLYMGGFTAFAAVCGLLVAVVVASPDHVVTRALSVSPLRFLGGISYSLYLWHWPVRVFLSEDRLNVGGFGLFTTRFTVSILLAIVSTYTVERWFRRASPHRTPPGRTQPGRTRLHFSSPWKWLPATAAAMGVVFVATVGAVSPVRSGVLPRDLVDVASDARPYEENGIARRPLRVLYLGDSVLWTLGGGKIFFPQPLKYDSPFPATDIALWNRSVYSCSLIGTDFLFNGNPARQRDGECSAAEKWVESVAEFHPDLVVLSSFFRDGYPHLVDGSWLTPEDQRVASVISQRLNDLKKEFAKLGARTVLLIQEAPGGCPSVSHKVGCGNFAALQNIWRQVAEKDPDFGVIELAQLVCGADMCPRNDGDPLYREDGVHYGPEAAPLLAARLQSAFEQAYRTLRST